MYFTRLDCIDRNNTVSKNLRCSIKRFRNNSNLLNGACDLNHVPAIFVYIYNVELLYLKKN